MPWCGLLIAALWWAAVAFACVTVLDPNRLATQPPITIAAGGLMAVLPGLLILMAGFMARESARSAAANALVLRAANELLDPAEANAARAETLASRMTAVSQDVDHAFSAALSALKALTSEIGDERLRLESVSYAAADNARDLAAALANERTSIETLIRELKAQAQTMNEAIPRQATMMTDMAKQAGDEIARADAALDTRLEAMRTSTNALTHELQRLEGLAASANGQSETVLFAIARIEEKLDQSRRTIETAVKASDAAVQAAQSSQVATRSVANGSGVPADQPSESIKPLAAQPMTAGPEPIDDELFDGGDSQPEPTPAVVRPAPAVFAEPLQESVTEETAPPPFDPFEEETGRRVETEPLHNSITTPAPAQNPAQGDAAWTSILTDIDRSDAGELSREDTAELVIQRLEKSGISLANIFRPKDKKRIAGATRKGEGPRHTAIIAAARGEVDRVSKRLRADSELARLAADFVTMEAPDAIAALERTYKSNRNASPRLSAFLLLDAATQA